MPSNQPSLDDRDVAETQDGQHCNHPAFASTSKFPSFRLPDLRQADPVPESSDQSSDHALIAFRSVQQLHNSLSESDKTRLNYFMMSLATDFEREIVRSLDRASLAYSAERFDNLRANISSRLFCIGPRVGHKRDRDLSLEEQAPKQKRKASTEVTLPRDWASKEKFTVPQLLKILKDHGIKANKSDGKDRLREEVEKLRQIANLTAHMQAQKESIPTIEHGVGRDTSDLTRNLMEAIDEDWS